MLSKHNSHHPTFQQNSYRKLRDNTWGAIVRGVEPRPGDPIVVVTRRGLERSEVVAQVHWGNGSEWLCSLVQSSATGELGDATDEPVSTASKYPHLMREKTDRP